MEIKPYNRKYLDVTKMLHKEGYITTYPKQIGRGDLETDDGVDIVYTFKNLTPNKFADVADFLLLAAFQEAERYQEYKYKFARIDVELNRNAKGRKTLGPVRSYTAAKNSDSEVMVYGEEVIGPLPEEYAKRPFLINKVEEIIDIANKESYLGSYTKKQSPYKVVRMIISVRVGLTRTEAIERKQVLIQSLREAVERNGFTDIH